MRYKLAHVTNGLDHSILLSIGASAAGHCGTLCARLKNCWRSRPHIPVDKFDPQRLSDGRYSQRGGKNASTKRTLPYKNH
jgi:hypothetical protein